MTALVITAAWTVTAVAVAVLIGRGIRMADTDRCPDHVPAWVCEQVEL